MKVALISFHNRFHEFPTRYSLGTMRLAAYIGKNEQINVRVIPINIEEEISEDIIKKLSNSGFDILGIPNFIWTEKIAQEISRKVLAINNQILCVIGGPSTRFVNATDWTGKEIFISGEGEEALLKICEEKIKDPSFSYKDIKKINALNIFSCEIPNGFFGLPKISGIPEGLPLFSPEVENMKDNQTPETFAWYETSRGCPYSCGYCGHKTRTSLGKVNLDIVKKEFLNIQRIGLKNLFIVDPILGGTRENSKHIIRLCNKIIPNTKIIAYFRPEILDSELIELLAKCNLENARFGIQTLNPNVPAWIRSNSIEKIKKSLSQLTKRNIIWHADLIVGLPGDDFIGLKGSIQKVIDELQPSILAGYHLTAIKGTPLYELVDNKTSEKWIKIYENGRVKESYSYSEEEFKEMAAYSTAILSLYNLMKKEHPRKYVDFNTLNNFIEKHLLKMDYSKLSEFDGEYATQYWQTHLSSPLQSLIIIRHGQSEGNQQKIIQGRQDSFHLTDYGRLEIKTSIEKYEDLLIRADRIVSSPMPRALESAALIQIKINKPIKVDETLIEFDAGVLTGQKHDTISKMYPAMYDIWKARKDLDGIPNAEAGFKLQARAIAFLMQYLGREYYTDILVSHAGFMRCLINTIEGRERTTDISLENASVHIFDNPLKNLQIEQKKRAMSSKVYLIQTANGKYVAKIKDRALTEADKKEEKLLNELSSQLTDLPLIYYMAENERGCSKILRYLSGEHLYGKLEKDIETVMTEKVFEIGKALATIKQHSFPKEDLETFLQEKISYSSEPSVVMAAKDLLSRKDKLSYFKNTEYTLVHKDINRDNVLFEKEKGHISAHILDWESISYMPKNYHFASYLASGILLENGDVRHCLNLAANYLPEENSENILFLMKLRVFAGLSFFLEKRKESSNEQKEIVEELLNKYLQADKKIRDYEIENILSSRKVGRHPNRINANGNNSEKEKE